MHLNLKLSIQKKTTFMSLFNKYNMNEIVLTLELMSSMVNTLLLHHYRLIFIYHIYFTDVDIDGICKCDFGGVVWSLFLLKMWGTRWV